MALNPVIDQLQRKLKFALVRLELTKRDWDDGLLSGPQAKNQAQAICAYIVARAGDLQTEVNNL